jgi:hypothetical protein
MLPVNGTREADGKDSNVPTIFVVGGQKENFHE